jgi:uracil-DNA glycosylase
VASGEAGSHRRKGWEGFTAEILRQLIGDPAPKVFILWGNDAAKLGAAIGEPHTVISSAHPSPLSARRGFFGSAPFSRANQALVATGRSPIQWGA